MTWRTLKQRQHLLLVGRNKQHTLALNLIRSVGLSVSAFATTGIKLTRVQSFFMTSMSSGFRVWPVGRMK